MKALLALGLGVIAASGCAGGARGDCPALDSCGGSPIGTWSMIKDACQFQPVRPAQPVDVMSYGTITPAPAMITPPQPNPVVLQQTTSGDWCSSLLYNQDDTILNVALWHDAPLLNAANLTFGPDFSYVTSLTFSTAGSTHFAPHCLMANGASMPTCDKLTTGLKGFYAMTASQSAPPSFTMINCTGDIATTGCDCTYVYTVNVADTGMWRAEGGTLLEDSSVGAFTYNGGVVGSQSPAMTIQSTFCAQGGLLELTGLRGGSLFGVQGLRTMILAPP